MPKYLLALTPRAGTMNHRYLVSPGSGLVEAGAAAEVGEALRNTGEEGASAEGPSFLAVCKRGVLQVEGGRSGDEVLLLGGIETAALGARRHEVQERLEHRLDDLSELIGRIEWHRERGMLIEHTELEEWLWSDFGDVREPRAEKRRLVMWSITLLALAAAVLVVVLVSATGGGQDQGRSPKEQTKQPK